MDRSGQIGEHIFGTLDNIWNDEDGQRDLCDKVAEKILKIANEKVWIK